MVFRIFVEKHKEYAHEAASLLSEARNILEIKGLEAVRIRSAIYHGSRM